MKTRAAKALTAAVVIGGTLFGVGGTSFAAGTRPKGALVYVYGAGAAAEEAKAKATSFAKAQCQSGKVTTDNYHKSRKWDLGVHLHGQLRLRFSPQRRRPPMKISSAPPGSAQAGQLDQTLQPRLVPVDLGRGPLGLRR